MTTSGDTIALYEKFKPRVIAPVELRWWLETQGVEGAAARTRTRAARSTQTGSRSRITDANHSSSIADRYTGEPTGLVVTLEDGYTLYFAGDTNVFGDMALIRRLYEPRARSAADRRPLHDGAKGGGRRPRAARCRALRPLPLGDVRSAHRHAGGVAGTRAGGRRDRRRRALRLSRSLWLVRERWLGATGRKVPEIVVEGEFDLPEGTLVLEGVDIEALREAFDERSAGRRTRGHGGRRESRAGATRGLVRHRSGGAPRADPARPPRAHVWLVRSSRRTPSSRAISRPDSGVSPSSRSSSASARSSPGPSPTWARSRRRRSRTLATAPRASPSCVAVRAPRRRSSA